MLKLELLIDELDYDSVFENYGTLIAERLRENGNPAGMLPPVLLKGFINGMPKEKRDEMAANLINSNRGKLQKGLEEVAASRGIRLMVVGAKAEAKE